MKTVTVIEAKNRLGQVIGLALAEKAVPFTKNERDSVEPVSAELSGQQGFIQDAYSKEKNRQRTEFAQEVGQGRVKSSDASMFKGMETSVKFRNEEF
ncbi:hypothetical protein [Sideroxydans sp.]